VRLKELKPDEMSLAQRQVADEAASGKRGHVPAPLRAWLRSPELGARAQRLGEFVRYDTVLGPKLSELAILITARFWTAHYEWFVHKQEALKAGLDPAIIEAIAHGREPAFEDMKMRAVYDYVLALHEKHRVSDSIHAVAMRELGEQGVVELVGVAGYYTFVAMTLNAFEFGLPEGESEELPP
jgi:4-carboxymuconolactone decarboxylase